MKSCKINGCDGKYFVKGYCQKHYTQVWRHGKILKRTRNDPNEIVVMGDIAGIALYNIKCQKIARAIIDAKDINIITDHKWCLSFVYVQTKINGKPIKMHQLIMGVPPNKNQEIDHKDGNPLNNRRSNLRFCTHIENCRNIRKPKTNTSGYKGVVKKDKGWAAQISINSKAVYLGTFKKKIHAAIAYNAAALAHYGEFAHLNLIKGEV